MERARRASVAALLALAVLSFSAAAASVTEVEAWSKRAAGSTRLVVLAGEDATSELVAVAHRVEAGGVNKTL